ncbi:tRNA pseudouridine synthase B [Rubellimicrobium mesophilum DSM 19309]|uniref:tRNA pseudouridine synthase B n=1 Tax=Rubellimicrobium mesophilum DSM 19309 TaxID=442562 RepID=A0A017HLE8_9RHOB|nr:tRNA pseudouridine(55) synthase TruB [Rubellimicrobium mesophilum]EYD75337.1 tRNA pseudouridine synthase B [Rubellimicrobium mesophilum DSM 19309]
MGRTRKGRAISGFLIVDKPPGITSTSVVNKVRWALEAQKAGHAGTLDPAATGLLAVALGEATKVLPYVTDALKAYDFTTRWGQETTTDDAEGEVAREADARPTDAAIEAALDQFRGDILQVPPAFSAVKVDGERAYDLARDGEVLELAARPLHVRELTLVARPDADHATLRMVCGKGGYVRSIARDLGRALGCLGHVTRLRRIWSGPFTVDGAVTWEEIEQGARTGALDSRLLPLETALVGLPECRCPELSVASLRNGQPAPVIPPEDLEWGEEAWASRNGKAIAIGVFEAGHLRPSRVFAA